VKKTIAMHVSPSGNEMIGDETWGGCMGYVAVTEYVTVDFPDLDPKEYVSKQVDLLKTAKDELHVLFLRESAAIDDQISKLTAITHQPED